MSRGLLCDCTTSPINRFAALVSCEVWERRILGHLFDSGGAVVTKEVVAAVHAEACVHVLNDQMILGSEEKYN